MNVLTAQTNIDQSIVRTRWMPYNLKTTTLRNGKKIRIVRDLKEWKRLHSSSDFREPAVFIRKTAYGEEYYYNYYTLIDAGNIAPLGYRLPKLEDFQNARIYFDTSNQLFDTSALQLSQYGYVMFSDQYFTLFDVDVKSVHFWIDSPKDAKDEYVNTAWIRGENGVTVSRGYSYPTDGILIRCIADNVIKAQESLEVLDYKLLMPSQYSALQKATERILSRSALLDDNQSIGFKYDLKFDQKGNNLSRVSALTDNVTPSILQQLQQELRSSAYEPPMYLGKPVMSSTTLNIDYRLQLRSGVRGQNLRSLISNEFFSSSIPTGVSDMLKVCSERGFTYTSKQADYSLLFGNGNDVIHGSTQFLSKVKGRGPLYSFCSVIPGLGITLLSKGVTETRSMKVFRKTILGTSISLGLISIASKIYSEIYYKRFLDDLDGANANGNYLNSNISQKVFITSALAYSALFVLDFKFTFILGCKNKMLQGRTNRMLRTINKNELIIK